MPVLVFFYERTSLARDGVHHRYCISVAVALCNAIRIDAPIVSNLAKLNATLCRCDLDKTVCLACRPSEYSARRACSKGADNRMCRRKC